RSVHRGIHGACGRSHSVAEHVGLVAYGARSSRICILGTCFRLACQQLDTIGCSEVSFVRCVDGCVACGIDFSQDLDELVALFGRYVPVRNHLFDSFDIAHVVVSCTVLWGLPTAEVATQAWFRASFTVGCATSTGAASSRRCVWSMLSARRLSARAAVTAMRGPADALAMAPTAASLWNLAVLSRPNLSRS